ncbi:MAG: efflux RND transporter permease subunit, partial [Proteobacteria bacterium]|nr:efflux RND transporter permease subunit [Pseudomonadota bacterium]
MSNLFFRYPRLTLLAIGFILLSGISSLITLPRQEDPTMAERFGTVETFLPGASASRVETLVTEKLEIALLTVPEIKTIDSVSRPGHSIISVELHDSVPREAVDLVWTEIRDEVAGVRAQLPVDASDPEIESRDPLGDTLAIGLLSTETPLAVMERIAIELESRLAAMPGTKETRIRGMPEQQITVNMDPWAMARSNIAIDELARVIGRSDTKRPAGRISGSGSDIVVEVKGDLSGTERISSIPVRELDDGTFLRVGDIASVRKSYADPPRTLAIVNGERAIVVSTTMETGRRVDQWVDDVKEIVAAYEAELPDMVRFVTIVDQNVYTNDPLAQLALNLAMAVILVLVVLFVLMGLRSALIVGAALPLTIAMVLAGLSALDIPLHQMSVTGLIIALGLLIDNAIVVVEEYKKNRRTGLEAGQAISTAVSHLAVPLLASTATTAFAFLPIATTPGGVGDFTGTMAVCVVLSVSSSFLLALTIIPAVAGFIDQRWAMQSTRRERWWINGIHLPGLSELYRRSLAVIVASPWKGIGLSLCLPMAGFLLAQGLTLSFFPPTDRNQFQVQINLPPSASIESTR